MLKEINIQTKCDHCGETCDETGPLNFCCNGCKQIYLLLKDSDLTQYYDIEKHPGVSRYNIVPEDLEYLKETDAVLKILSFRDEKLSKVNFKLPAIHCASCLYLLENLPKLHAGISNCTVNFLEKKAYITFEHDQIELFELVSLLYKIGYEPELNFSKLHEEKNTTVDRSLLLKIGVAGFSFGNIMLLSFPEYLGFADAASSYYLGYINILLALPVFFYSGYGYLSDAVKNIKQGNLGIHVPLAIGMITLFLRSVYEILSTTGEGYLDSFAGFVLFLLIGQWFQDFTKKSIAFDRDYRSYFPIAIQVLSENSWISKSIDKIEVDEIIKVRSGEIIPCDGELIAGNAQIDYSFVTGETTPKSMSIGEPIFAGGKQTSSSIEIKVSKTVDQGYLTQLWQESPFKEAKSSKAELLLNNISKYFTWTILAIATLTFLFWIFVDVSTAFRSITAVLIVACPCALALSVPFILGNATRILGKKEFYARSTETLEKLLDIDTIVFDKTGTITENKSMNAAFIGNPLSATDRDIIFSVTSQSSHPLSTAISQEINGTLRSVSNYVEVPGKGIIAECEGKLVKIGSASFILGAENNDERNVIIEMSHQIIGHYTFEKKLRRNISNIITNLSSYKLALLSGDNERERSRMKEIFPEGAVLNFEQSPKDKLKYIKELQANGASVMMVGDGLNDAGALKQSDVGMVVSEDNNTFTPACDAIISSDRLAGFIQILDYVKKLKVALIGAFIIAFLYNFIGLGFAVTGNLSPIVAAILMPTSSITIMVYGLLVSKWLSLKLL
ncbi:heavy metal translocating P-type ATPase [Portibacter lacus]|uniref:ATPase n=1 Tax=Portibacter lacus TaxID=1099794 RepID=A0AA37SPM5_9BACT|nr:heavy metal translocating P-type ATPase metal-binding domain-containing protein [Portibacter lacus]GLR17182.1 ATPase [Portibacter lacus]